MTKPVILLQRKHRREILPRQVYLRKDRRNVRTLSFTPTPMVPTIIELKGGLEIDEIVIMNGNNIELVAPVRVRLLESQKVDFTVRYALDGTGIVGLE